MVLEFPYNHQNTLPVSFAAVFHLRPSTIGETTTPDLFSPIIISCAETTATSTTSSAWVPFPDFGCDSLLLMLLLLLPSDAFSSGATLAEGFLSFLGRRRYGIASNGGVVGIAHGWSFSRPQVFISHPEAQSLGGAVCKKTRQRLQHNTCACRSLSAATALEEDYMHLKCGDP